MSAEVNGNHAIARFDRAWIFVEALNIETGEFEPQLGYEVCGEIIVTSSFVFARGHYGESGNYEPVITIGYPRDHVYLIQDQSVNPCQVHDEMDAEAKALMETAENAKENPQGG